MGPLYVNRRTFVTGLVAAACGAALSACGQQAPAAASRPAPSASSGDGWQAQWEGWIAAAKQEGKLVLGSGPSPTARVQIPEAFSKRFGVSIEYLGGSTSDLANRLRSEQAVNQYTVDVTLSGSDTTYLVLYGQHMTEPIRPHLIHPEVLDDSAWINGKVWYMDPDEQYIVRASNYISQQIAANADYVKIDEIKAWHDLLNPQYKGKIATYDPLKAGSGGQMSAYLWTTLGADFVKSLYVDQNVAVTQDYRQLSDWLARGVYPIAMAIRTEDVDQLKKDGFKVQQMGAMSDAAPYVSAGFGLVNLLKSPPHPNAAKLFLNWILMKEGQTVWNSTQKTVSVRKDVNNTWAAPEMVPKPGVKYFDTYAWEYTTKGWPKANAAVKSILGH